MAADVHGRTRHCRRAAIMLAALALAHVLASSPDDDPMTPPTAPPSVRPPLPTAAEIAALPPDGGDAYNRLVFEKSPYLLQHAANPVDWWPWGEAAFERARADGKPIFLSIGYATCHWCHVMEHESFEDAATARMINETFVPIKVDREERPDVDHIYMTVCQAMTGHGGWPLTVFLTPDRKPFFAGTYFPRTSRGAHVGLQDLVTNVGRAWTEDRLNVVASAERMTAALQGMAEGAPGDALDARTLDDAFASLRSRFDQRAGGFGHAPKFPTPHNLLFLLRRWQKSLDPSALTMVERTLSAMRRGGIFDHVGYGFHRYSTDPVWLLPHFEKMLYDQALLMMAYTEAHQATGRAEFAQTAREIATYVLRDMTAPGGGFYSAEDADSEGVEGLFYLWTPEDVAAAADDAEDAALWCEVYNVKAGGNFREEAGGGSTGHSIPHLTRTLESIAKEKGVGERELTARLERIRATLFAVRERRIHPLKDDKVLTDWNGLMIAALAKAGRALDEPEYTAAAARAAEFVFATLRAPDGRLLKRFRDGEAGLAAHLDDYAFMVWGLIELYESTYDARWLERAIALNAAAIEHFWDEERGAFFMAEAGATDLIARAKEIYDGAIPSGNSVSALNMLRLARLTGDTALEERAATILRAFSAQVGEMPVAHTMLLCAVDFALGPTHEVVVVGEPGAADTRALLAPLQRRFLPSAVVLLRPAGDAGAPITALAPFTAAMEAREGAATAYVCRDFACSAPTTSLDTMLDLLR